MLKEAVTEVVVWYGYCIQDRIHLDYVLTPSLSPSLSLFHVIDMRGQCQLWMGQNNMAAYL